MHRRLLVLVIAFVLALGAVPATAAPAPDLAPLHEATGEAIDGSYIVVLKPGRSAAAVARQSGVTTTHDFGEVLDGFAANLDARQLDRVRRNPNVAWVEANQVATIDHHQIQANPTWGLDRIDQRYLPLDNRYIWHADATKINVYVFDTGIDYGHPEFGGRAQFAYDAFGGTGFDCHGHGTHVSGTIGSKTYGVSKQSQLWSVRVLDCSGSGSYAGIINAANWVAANYIAPAIANFSLGGPFSAAVNAAIDNLSNAGVFVAVAAGNSAANACNATPASASQAYTIAASDINDISAWFTNHGACVDIYAPGVSITSTIPGGGTAIFSGTSMASPHVAGVAAQYKAYVGDQPSPIVANFITSQGTPGILIGVPINTPNLLLFKSWRL
jgi:subtilisin family serine protease